MDMSDEYEDVLHQIRLSTRSLAAVGLCLALLGGACSPQASQPPASASPAAAKPAPPADLKAIHRSLLIPGSELLYAAESAPPAAQEAWTTIRAGAGKVAQAAQQLMAQGQVHPDWAAILGRLDAAARSAEAASASADTDRLRAADAALAEACNACHQAFGSAQP